MTVFVAFATVEGQTGKIARFVSDEVRSMGRDVSVLDVDETASADFSGVEHVVLAASVHERRHPRSFEAFIAASKEELQARRTMLLSVSLSAAFPEGIAEAEDYVVEMNMRTELSPDVTLLVPGAVQEGAYDYLRPAGLEAGGSAKPRIRSGESHRARVYRLGSPSDPSCKHFSAATSSATEHT